MSQNHESSEDHIRRRYEDSVGYYYAAARSNKRAYKWTRSLTIILSALVTLIASLSSALFITSVPFLKILFAIATPVMAAVLTIVSGFSQNFQWGAAWRDMIINGERLQKEQDRFYVMQPNERDLAKEVEFLNDLVISETQTFFQRILCGTKKEKNDNPKV